MLQESLRLATTCWRQSLTRCCAETFGFSSPGWASALVLTRQDAAAQGRGSVHGTPRRKQTPDPQPSEAPILPTPVCLPKGCTTTQQRQLDPVCF